MRRIFSISLIALFLSANVFPAYCELNSAEYLCGLGLVLFRQERFNEALIEFNKTLMVDPGNTTAKKYISKIFEKELNTPIFVTETKEPVLKKTVQAPYLNQQTKSEKSRESAVEKDREGIKITGTSQLAFGVANNDFILKRANFDLNERNWRMLSSDNFDRKFNTYDPRVFDSLSLNIDTDQEEGFNFHSNITVDPWSFTGKTDSINVYNGSNRANIQLKYFSSTGYTLSDTAYVETTGDTFSIPELKVSDGKTASASGLASQWTGNFSVPSMKIHRSFQPIREIWLDYSNDSFKFRAFPLAYQDQAFTSDDPLGISNHHIWWENSLWLRNYKKGFFNSGGPDFVQGSWDNSLASLRDSNGSYVGGLRGFSFDFYPQENTSIRTSLASPKTPWQDYADADNIISATRIKHFFDDRLMAGAVITSRHGFLTNPGTELDSRNYVGGLDIGYEIADGLKGSAEVLFSKSDKDLTYHDYSSDIRGNAYYLSLVSRYPKQSIMDLEYGYDQIELGKGESLLFKTKFFAAHMDMGFDSALSSYRNTRSDTFWSRHISFRRPFEYYQYGLSSNSPNWDELNATRIGDGIDTGRDVVGFRAEAEADNGFKNLFDLRNVHKSDGKFLENVVRDETTMQLGGKLTVKTLGIYHKLHNTYGGIDPFIVNNDTGDFVVDWSSDPIDDGKDPTLKTGSLGAEYAFFDWLSVNGIWEYTNDYTLAYGNYPRGVFNSSQLSRLYFDESNPYRDDNPNLYDQYYFPQPPYSFYNIYKCGFRLMPLEKLDIYLDYVRNEFKLAGQNTDNMNHFGLELTYMPTEKFGMALKYTYSRWEDFDRLRSAGESKLIGRHNVFAEFKYFASENDEFILQLGEGNSSPIGNITYDPSGGSLLSLDTQSILRCYYRRNF